MFDKMTSDFDMCTISNERLTESKLKNLFHIIHYFDPDKSISNIPLFFALISTNVISKKCNNSRPASLMRIRELIFAH